MRNREVQPILVRNEQGCARACSGRDMSQPSEAVAVLLLEHVEVAFAPTHVQPFSGGVVEQIVGVADDIERCDFLPCGRVVHKDLRRPPASDEHSMIRLIERHREVRLRSGHWPGRNHLQRIAVDDRNLIGGRNVHERPSTGPLELKRFGMAGELGFAQHFPVGGADRSESAAAESDEETLRRRLVSHVVRVVSEADALDRMKVTRVERLHTVALTVGDSDKFRVGYDGDPLRLAKADQAFEVSAALEIENLRGIVAECCDEQSLRARIERQMIDAAFDSRKIDPADQVERSLTSEWLERDQTDNRHRENDSHDRAFVGSQWLKS